MTAATATKPACRIDVATIKDHVGSDEATIKSILANVAGIPHECLDGRHHPLPGGGWAVSFRCDKCRRLHHHEMNEADVIGDVAVHCEGTRGRGYYIFAPTQNKKTGRKSRPVHVSFAGHNSGKSATHASKHGVSK